MMHYYYLNILKNYLNSNWFWHMANAEIDYNKLIAGKWQPQQARCVLPNSLKTDRNRAALRI